MKIQMLRPDRIAHPTAKKYWEHGDDATQIEVYERNGNLSVPEIAELGEWCHKLEMRFVVTPFDEMAVASLKGMSDVVDYIKIASGDVTNLQLLEVVNEMWRPWPIILSTGAANWVEVAAAMTVLSRGPNDQIFDVVRDYVLACSLQYPTPPDAAGFGRIGDLRIGLIRREIRASVGYSDHTLGTWSAGPLGPQAELIEKHVSLERKVVTTENPDLEIAITPSEVAEFVQTSRRARRAQWPNSLVMHTGEVPAHHGARRSLWWATDVPAGVPVQRGLITTLRPGPKLGQLGGTDFGRVFPDVFGELSDGTSAAVPPWFHTPLTGRSVYHGHPVMWADIVEA